MHAGDPSHAFGDEARVGLSLATLLRTRRANGVPVRSGDIVFPGGVALWGTTASILRDLAERVERVGSARARGALGV